MSGPLLVVMTRAPTPGQVKTRLIPALGAHGAAALHRALLHQTLQKVRESGLPARVALDGREPALADHLRVEGWTVEPQAQGDLGARMRHALRGPGRRVLIGTDIPLLQTRWLVQAAHSPSSLVLGPAVDGGYWLIAVDDRARRVALFDAMPWSTPQVLARTLERARAAGLTPELLPLTADLDTPEDLAALRHDARCPPAIRQLLDAPG